MPIRFLAAILGIVLCCITGNAVESAWTYTSSSPLHFEFLGSGTYIDPSLDTWGSLPYSSAADSPHSTVKINYGITEVPDSNSYHRHGLSSSYLGIRSAGEDKGRSIVSCKQGVADNTFSINTLDWSRGVVYETRTIAIGSFDSDDIGKNYAIGGLMYNFWNLSGNPVGAPLDSTDTGVVLCWLTKSPNTDADDTIGIYDVATNVPIAVVDYPLGTGTGITHTYQITARRSPLPWNQQNDLVLVTVFVDGTAVQGLTYRTLHLPANSGPGYGNAILAGSNENSTVWAPRGDRYAYIRIWEDNPVVDTTPPTHPTGLTVDPAAQGVTLSWSAATDAATAVIGYRIKRNGEYLAYTEWHQTNYNDQTGGFDDAYAVYAVDAAGNESVLMDADPPSSPTNVQAVAVSSAAVDITWNASLDNVGVAGYRIFRDGSLAGVSITTSYTDTDLQPQTIYSYTVVAYDAVGNTSNPSAPPVEVTTLADTEPPSVPTEVRCAPLSATAIYLEWSASTDNGVVAGYNIYRDGNAVGTSYTTSFTDTGLQPGGAYFYTVSAYDLAQNESAQSAPPALGQTFAAAWNYSTSSPLLFEFTDNTSGHINPSLGMWGVLPYSTTANSPHDGVKINIGITELPSGNNAYVHSFSLGHLGIRSGGDDMGRSLAASRQDDADNEFSLDGLDWSRGIVYETRVIASGSGDAEDIYKNHSIGGLMFNFWDLGGPNMTSDQASGAVLCWLTKDATRNSDDTIGLYDVSTNAAIAVATHPFNVDPSAALTFKLVARRSPLLWDQRNDKVLVTVYVDGTPVPGLIERTLLLPGNPDPEYANAILLGDNELENDWSPRGDRYDYVKLYEPEAVVDFDPPTHPVVQGTDCITWTPSTDATTRVIGYRIKRNGHYIAYTEWDQTSYYDDQYMPGDVLEAFAVDAAGNESIRSDILPPSVPADVQASLVGPTSVRLTWAASTDNVGVAGYRAFRNGAYTGTSSIAEFVDTALQPATGYTYTVSAYDDAGNTSALSEPAEVFTATSVDLATARMLSDGAVVSLGSKVVSAIFNDHFYVQEMDRYAGIRVVPTEIPAQMQVGQSVSVWGTVMTLDNGGERYIAAEEVVLHGSP